MLVLKTTSPNRGSVSSCAERGAGFPKALPEKVVPSSRMRKVVSIVASLVQIVGRISSYSDLCNINIQENTINMNKNTKCNKTENLCNKRMQEYLPLVQKNMIEFVLKGSTLWQG